MPTSDSAHDLPTNSHDTTASNSQHERPEGVAHGGPPGDSSADAPGPDGQPRKRRRRRRRRGRKPDGAGPAEAGAAVADDPEASEGDGPDDDEGPEGANEGTEVEAPAALDESDSGGAAHEAARAAAHALKGQDIFDATQTFADLGLRNSVVRAVEAMGFKRPTKIQAQLIPPALAGKDVLGQAKTGSGKTAAFGLPLFHMATRGLPFQSIILVPTRELAQQVAAEMNELGQFTPIKTSAVFGGESIQTQSRNLEQGPEIIVATPGRLMDMLERGRIHLNNVKFVVLDEVDRMLDIGFRDDIRKILGGVRGEHRTIFVSATISPEIESLARKYMRDPEKIVAAAGSLTVSLVEQHYLTVNPWDKRKLLLHLLTHEEPTLTVVFCRTKRTVDDVAEYLQKHKVDVQAIHGDMQQGRRNRVMTQLRGGHLTVLIASDLAARGLDVEDISHVINYDLPEDPEVYIHRIGRTARAGRGGIAWSFVTRDQGELLTAIEQLANIEIPKMDYPDFVPTPPPEGSRYGSGGGGGGGGRGYGGGRRDDRGPRRDDRPRDSGPPRDDRGPRRDDRPRDDRGPRQDDRPREDRPRDDRGPRRDGPPAPQAPAKPAAPAGPAAPGRPDPSRFPGGLVPTKMPPRLMGGRVKTSRSGRGQGPPPPAPSAE